MGLRFLGSGFWGEGFMRSEAGSGVSGFQGFFFCGFLVFLFFFEVFVDGFFKVFKCFS